MRNSSKEQALNLLQLLQVEIGPLSDLLQQVQAGPLLDLLQLRQDSGHERSAAFLLCAADSQLVKGVRLVRGYGPGPTVQCLVKTLLVYMVLNVRQLADTARSSQNRVVRPDRSDQNGAEPVGQVRTGSQVKQFRSDGWVRSEWGSHHFANDLVYPINLVYPNNERIADTEID